MNPPLSAEAVRRLLGTPNPPPIENHAARGMKPRIPQHVVDAIRQDRARGHRLVDVAERYGVSPGYVSQVCNGQCRADGKPATEPRPPCQWREDADGLWHSSCRHCYTFDHPFETGGAYSFCPGCSGAIQLLRRIV